MKRTVIVVLLLLLIPCAVQAEYTFILKNGSEIGAIQTYSERDGEVTVYFSTGSMIISKQDILRIEGSEAEEERAASGAQAELRETRESREEPAGRTEESGGMNERKAVLDTELDTLRNEIRAAEKQEMDLVTTINEKIGADKSYNLIQRRQREKEIEPLQKELSGVQEKKRELLEKMSALENQRRLVQ
ncbi:MAG: hypothetical protein ACOYVJ_06285 [Nitrospirota bacterium]